MMFDPQAVQNENDLSFLLPQLWQTVIDSAPVSCVLIVLSFLITLYDPVAAYQGVLLTCDG